MSNTVAVVSDEQIISTALKNALVAKGCKVFSYFGYSEQLEYCRYVVVINASGKLSLDGQLISTLNKRAPKTVVVQSLFQTHDFALAYDTKSLYVDQLYPGYSSLIEGAIEQLDSGGASQSSEYAYVSMLTMLNTIERELFSFTQKKDMLVGSIITTADIYQAYGRPVPQLAEGHTRVLPRKWDQQVSEPLRLGDLIQRAKPRVVQPEVEEVAANSPPEAIKPAALKKSLVARLAPLRANLPKLRLKTRLPAVRINKKVALAGAFALLVVLGTPLAALAVSVFAGTSAYHHAKQGNYTTARSMIAISTSTASFAEAAFWQLSKIPIIGMSFTEAHGASALVERSSFIAGKVLSVASYTSRFSDHLVGGGGDIVELSRSIHLELAALYRDLSFLEGQIQENKRMLPDFVPELNNLESYREYVLAASKLALELPAMFGHERTMTYMVLLQNNMELRPTGGFIGSFALLTFSEGQIVDNTIYDVYSADGQLKGYIKPPEPIVEHLGEASWTLRDSNWDPDFPTSARRAEWFLDKSMDRQVDGVIAINLEVIKAYLEVLGPVHMPDFDDTVDHKNMYEKVQHEVEESFFPGSRKKAQYLSALSAAVIDKVSSQNATGGGALLLASLDKLKSRDIQVYMNDPKVNGLFSSLGWGGSVDVVSCELENCATAFAGIVEANVGVNKANYFVKRKISSTVTLMGGSVGQEVALEIVNTAAHRDRIPEHRYKAYVRAIAPRSSVIGAVSLESRGAHQYLEPDVETFADRVEYGVLVEVLPGENKKLVFRWVVPGSLDVASPGTLRAHWWKQSGTGEYPGIFIFDTGLAPVSSTNPPMSLTDAGKLRYNTGVSESMSFEISW